MRYWLRASPPRFTSPERVSPSSKLTLQDCLVRTRAAAKADKCAAAIVQSIDILATPSSR